MEKARRLKVAEQAVVDPAVRKVFELVLPKLQSMRIFVMDELEGDLPEDLVANGWKDFMNMLGNEMFSEGEPAASTR